jgi:hypothetical protein
MRKTVRGLFFLAPYAMGVLAQVDAALAELGEAGGVDVGVHRERTAEVLTLLEDLYDSGKDCDARLGLGGGTRDLRADRGRAAGAAMRTPGVRPDHGKAGGGGDLQPGWALVSVPAPAGAEGVGPCGDWPVPVGRVVRRHGLTYVHAAEPGGFSVEDFRRIPDGRAELVDGVVVLRPEPSPEGLRMLARICEDFADGGCPAGYAAVAGPVDVRIGPATVLRPDVAVRLLGDDEGVLPVLVVEARPDYDTHHRWEERRAKFHGYRDAGVASYWMLNEETGKIRVYELNYMQRPKPVGYDRAVATGASGDGGCGRSRARTSPAGRSDERRPVGGRDRRTRRGVRRCDRRAARRVRFVGRGAPFRPRRGAGPAGVGAAGGGGPCAPDHAVRRRPLRAGGVVGVLEAAGMRPAGRRPSSACAGSRLPSGGGNAR